MCLTAAQDEAWGAKTTSLDEFGRFLDHFHEAGYNEVDTSRVYQNGEQESFTAAVGWKKRGLELATKVRRSHGHTGLPIRARNARTEELTRKRGDITSGAEDRLSRHLLLARS
jgi:aflatoxin B1 aldehyde reductase